MKSSGIAIVLAVFACSGFAQAPDDSRKFNLGATIFADFTYQESPEISDVDKNNVKFSTFQVTRGYINFTGQLNHLLAFRITPDISRETNSARSLSGSQAFQIGRESCRERV